MIGLALALLGGLGVFYLFTATAMGWDGVQIGPAPLVTPRRSRSAQWLAQAGLDALDLSQFLAGIAAVFVIGAGVGFVIFGGALAAIVVGALACSAPPAAYRMRRKRLRRTAQQAWPHMIEEMRVLTGAAGRSVPQSLFDVGERAPQELRGAFEAARREWLLTTDFEKTLDVLKAGLADPTADVVAETLLIAHQLGGTDLDHRLRALAEDRITDDEGRKDAMARQAGARFARWFTLVVPAGMALVGMSIGDGRAAYRTFYGQVFVVVALMLVAICWVAAGSVMSLPRPKRVFPESARARP